jgi:surface polysaccharide O-acyltransferase-like enzyme
METNAAPAARKTELDALRVITVLGVFFYHSLRFFNVGDWHVKNAARLGSIDMFLKFFEIWGMPLLFVISGAGAFYSLRRRTAAAFLKDKVLRLLVPLAVSIPTHIAWQVYLERRTHGAFAGSFARFYPRYFDGFYSLGGNFAWSGLHLWYLEMLFLLLLILLPLLAWLRRGGGRSLMPWLASRFDFPGGPLVLAVPIALAMALPDPQFFWSARIFGGWSLLGFVVFLLNGFFLVSDERLYGRARRVFGATLAGAISLTVVLVVWFGHNGEPVFGSPSYRWFLAAFGLNAWLWVLAWLGFGARRLSRPRAILLPLNEAVLPFYILHQTVLLTIGAAIVPLAWPIGLKWAAIAVPSFAVCAALYMGLIRGNGPLRLLFGMPPRPAAATLAIKPALDYSSVERTSR